MAYTPYTEAPVVRTTVQPTTGGMDTVEFDHLRQGVSIRNDRDRYAGTMPKLGTGRNDHQFDVVTYGQPSEFDVDDTTWEMVDLFDPVTYINVIGELTGSLVFPIANSTILDPEDAGGLIEPLELGVRDLIVVDRVHTVRGMVMAGNEDSFGKTSAIVQFVTEFNQTVPNDVYIDSSDNIGASSGQILIPGIFPETEKVFPPYDEMMALSKTVATGSIPEAYRNTNPAGALKLMDFLKIVSGSEIEKALVAMTGSSTAEYVPPRSVSKGTGFTYDNAVYGTDSIAYGGLLR